MAWVWLDYRGVVCDDGLMAPPQGGSLGSVENNSSLCEHERHVETILFTSVMAAAPVIALLMTFTHKRESFLPNFLWGVPGIFSPVNMFRSTSFRIVYCLILSAMSGNLLRDILDSKLYFKSDHAILNAIDFFVYSPTVMIVIQLVSYFPVFACVDSPIPVLGHTIGFFYMCLLSGFNTYREYVYLHGCSETGNVTTNDIGISLGMMVPIYVMYVMIILWFFIHAVMEVTTVIFARQPVSTGVCERQLYKEQVRDLLRRPVKRNWFKYVPKPLEHFVNGVVYVLPYNPSSAFRLPLPFMGAVAVSTVIIYQLLVTVTAHEIIYTNRFVNFLKGFDITFELLERIFPDRAGSLQGLYADLVSFGEGLRVMFPLSAILACFFGLLFLCYMIFRMHQKLSEAARGKNKILFESEPRPSLSYCLAAAMRFCSFQIGYLILAGVLYHVFLFALATLGLVLYYGFKDFTFLTVHYFSWALIPMMWSAAVYYLQLFLSKYVFCPREERVGKFIRIKHWRLLQLVTYVLFYYNVLFGAVMNVLRMLGLVVFSFVMSFRLDLDIYMRGLEQWDMGYRTYIGYAYLEYNQNNPVLQVFVQLMASVSKKKETKSCGNIQDTGSNSSVDSERSENTPLIQDGRERKVRSMLRVSKRAYNRWKVAYTLLRNPSLLKETASNLNQATGSITSDMPHHDDL